ncbi:MULTISPECIES: polysaccharide biosynthesis tyrosine autokinase [unclassified Sagittula]|uniref:GumC family protein n=1 Tax=unclassified Sagittula TaxID=2624628 RepID=UPI0020C80307|nr:polysaccharide biosynthesis tyrosine autokinase [Sagittula sp. P11]
MKSGPQTIPSSPKADQASKIDPLALLSAVWRGKILIGFVVFVALLIGGYYAYVAATPMFQSTAVVMLNNREEQVVDLNNVIGGLGSDSTVVNTEVEVLKSRVLLGKVVDQLDLTTDPEFNPSLRDPGRIDMVRTQIRNAILPRPSAPAEIPEEERQREAAINRLLGATSIRNVPSSVVFQVTVETTDRRKSALIANTIVDTYILNQLEVKFAATEQATSWLTERVSGLQQALEAAEAKVTDFRAATTLISQEALSSLEIQVKDLRDRILDAESSLVTAQARLAEMEAADTPQQKVEASRDPQLQRLLNNIDDEATAQTFENRFNQNLVRARTDVERQQDQLALLERSLTSREEQITRQNEDLITLQQLTREAEASRLLYEYFLTRLKETSAQQGIQQADSRIISPAVVPIQPSSPRKPLILAMAAMIGLLLGSAYILLRELRDRAFRTSQDLETTTGYTVVGQIPMFPIKKRRPLIEHLKTKPASAPAEAVRNLRTSVMLFNIDNPPKVLMTCSSLPGEGKTTVAFALTQNYAAMGKRVLLIEGDLRRRVFKDYLSVSSDKGLLSVLSGAATPEEVILHDELTGADILFGEKGPSNAADVFATEQFSMLMRRLRDMYDIVIIDTPPVLIVPDARLIAQNVDATLFVVRWDQTQSEQVLAALREFESVGKPVSGLVLNQISPEGMKRYGYGYANYSNYGGKYYQR